MNDRVIRKLLRSTLTETEEDYQPSKLETYLVDVFGCKLTSRQRQRIAGIVTVPGSDGLTTVGSAVALYDNDPDFPSYVQSKVDWALNTGHNLTQAVNRTRCVGAICKFFDPYYGWLVYKQRRMNGRHRDEGDTETSKAKESPDEGGKDTDRTTTNPTLGEFLATLGDNK